MTEDFFFPKKLEECRDLPDVFEVVKEAVETVLGKSRAGLMLGLANLGGSRQQFIGAFYPVASNLIVMNTFPIKRILETKKELFKPYVFGVLLHEYLHSLNYFDEATVRSLVCNICSKLFGKNHVVSRLSCRIEEFLPSLAYPNFGWFPEKEPKIQIVSGFDKGHLTYVA